jgi:hypothetical protein
MRWKDPNSSFNSKEHRQRLSDAMKAMVAKQAFKNPYSRALRGKRADIGDIFFKS